MTTVGIPLRAQLVIDNSFLVMLSEYYCARNACTLTATNLIEATGQWMISQLVMLKQFTPDGRLHCTDCVSSEYKPEAGGLANKSGVTYQKCLTLKKQACAQLCIATVDPSHVVKLRSLPAAPKRLVGPNGVSDEDLSLVALALQLASEESPVYVLTNDADLISFMSWVGTCKAEPTLTRHRASIQGLLGLSYMEQVHRACHISTDQMADLISFALVEHYKREDVARKEKGLDIMNKFVRVNEALIKSVAIKALSSPAGSKSQGGTK